MVYPEVSTGLLFTTYFEPCSWIEKQELGKSGNRKDDSRNKRKQNQNNKIQANKKKHPKTFNLKISLRRLNIWYCEMQLRL